MKTSSRFLSLAVAFVGLGVASGCTYSKTLPTVEHVDREETSLPAPPDAPKDTPKDAATEDETIAPVEAVEPTEAVDVPAVEEAEAPADAPITDDAAPEDTSTGSERPSRDFPSKSDVPGFGQSEKDGENGNDANRWRTSPSNRLPIFPQDATPPQFDNVTHSGDGKRFVIVFSEPVSLASVETAFTFESFDWTQAAFVPVKGTMTSMNQENSGKLIRFVADESLVDLTPGQVSSITFFRIRIAGADSADPSVAVKDSAGNTMAHEVNLEGTCREMPAGAPYQVECK